MAARLVERHGLVEGTIYDLAGGLASIGRGLRQTVRVDAPLVSRRHAEIREHGQGFVIVDVSVNGTWVNSRRLEPNRPQALHSGDCITLPGVDLQLLFWESEEEIPTLVPESAAPGPVAAAGPRNEALREPSIPLTPREREIAGLVAQGLTNRQIAEQLIISERTVDAHVANILSKLDFNSRAQIAAWAAKRGLATPY
jgi:DNA-binding CsgD family transcriptional regulator